MTLMTVRCTVSVIAGITILGAAGPSIAGSEPAAVLDLASRADGARLQSWDAKAAAIPDHEPEKANDGSLRTFWMVEGRDLPADLGIEWPSPQEISCIIIRYRYSSYVPIRTDARTQQLLHLQAWDGKDWQDLDANCGGEISRVARFTFPAVKTTRIRAVFDELPTFVFRPGTENPGLCVSEMEAYTRPPFQEVDFWKVAKYYVQNTGSLFIEPKRTRVFSDVLTPTLIVAESEWAKKPSSASTAGNAARLENGFLQLDLSTGEALAETRLTNRVTDESVATPRAEAFILRTQDGKVRSGDFRVKSTSAKGSSPDTARLRVELTSPQWDAVVFYELRRQDHFYHKWLTLTPKANTVTAVLDVTLSALRLPHTLGLTAGESQELSYPLSFLDKGGFFSCVETVAWDHRSDEVTYYPGATLKPGETFTTEKAAVGVFRKRGQTWIDVDRGAREWLIEYHAQVSPMHWSWPDVYCEGWSAKVGLEEVKTKPEWMRQFMKNAGRIGIRYMDGWEPVHMAMQAPAALVDEWVSLAAQNQISTGWWIDHSLKYRAQMSQRHQPFKCCLSPEAGSYYRDIVEFVRNHHLKAFHLGDFLQIQVCNETNHGHLPGKYSIYPQEMRILKLSNDIHATDPKVRLNADLGWYNPQWVRFVDSAAHLDHYDARPAIEPDLHLDRLYADMNRRYMQVKHAVFLHPWFRDLNCVNHFGQETHHHDKAGFRYALLSALGVAAQLTMNDAPDNTPESEYDFSQRWIAWGNQFKDYLKQGDVLFDRSPRYVPDVIMGDAECLGGFAHIRKDRGLIFLMNPTVCEQIADLKLALDAPEDQKFRVDEVYPGGCTLRGPAGGLYQQGGVLRVTVPAKQVRILWIAPASASETASPVQPEDFRAAPYRRFVGDWKLGETTQATASVKARFSYPAMGGNWLKNPAPASEWTKEPWNFDKAYLMLVFSDEHRDSVDLWVQDSLFPAPKRNAPAPEWVRINGVAKPIYPFASKRFQEKGMTQCYFVGLGDEIKLGAANDIELLLPFQSQLVFCGAYLDLPDQMPDGVQGAKNLTQRE